MSLASLTAFLAACDLSSISDLRTRPPDPFEGIRSVDLDPRFPRHPAQGKALEQRARASVVFGSEDGGRAALVRPASSGEGFELNFENAPVATVARVILGDILSVGYTIDPRITGTVTISSGRPVPRTDLLFILENALRMSNVVMVPDSGGYRLIPGGEAVGSGRVNGTALEAGFGISVVPLRHVSAQTILKLLDSFAVKPGIARAEPTRNLIVIQGSGPEREAAISTILSFDVDWMRGQSVGVFPVRNATPEAIVGELEKVMESGEGGLNHNIVKLQPIGRLNAVLVVARQPTLLRRAGTWIARLDRIDSAGAAVRVYRVRYGDARQMAILLNDIFGGRTASGADPTQTIAPGAGVARTSSGARGLPVGESFGGQRGSGFGQLPADGRSRGLGPGVGTQPGGSPGLQTAAGGIPGVGASGTARETADATATSVVLPGIRITADTSNNALLIYANQENYRLVEQTLRQLDRPQLQVAIHATIAEITLNNELRYGVQYFLKSKDIGLGEDKGSINLTNSATQAVLGRVLPGLNLLLGPEADARVIIDALRGVTDVKVLSTPSVVVLDNQIAALQVGDQVPIATQSATILTNPNTPLVNTIDYRNTGVILRVLPRINVNGNVTLDIEQEISAVAQNANTNTLTPTVSQRKVRSSVAVASGQSVLLGGLIAERHERGRSGIPVLEELPGIGDLFARNTRATTRTELIIFIRPQIVRDSVDAARIAQELRAKLKGSAEMSFPPGPSLRNDPRIVR